MLLDTTTASFSFTDVELANVQLFFQNANHQSAGGDRNAQGASGLLL